MFLFLGSLNRCFIQLISCGDDYQFQELIRIFVPVLIRSIEVQNEDFRKKSKRERDYHWLRIRIELISDGIFQLN